MDGTASRKSILPRYPGNTQPTARKLQAENGVETNTAGEYEVKVRTRVKK